MTNPRREIALRPDDAIDLQLHTVYSDGHWRPDELFDHLAARGFRAIAVTDHDTVAGLDEVRAQGEARGVLVVPGVEATASWHGEIAHVLCYARDDIGEPLRAVVSATVAAMEANTRDVYAELVRSGYTFARQREVLAASGGEPRRPVDNATLLVAHGYAQDLGAALEMIADAGYRIAAASIADVVTAAHAAGALAILAHPGRGGGEIHAFPPHVVERLLDEVPLDGVEAHYPLHTPEQVAAYHRLARHRGLLVSAGSDSHGPDQRLPFAYPAALAESLLVRLGIAVADRRAP